ncbi:MAG: methyl-accepting chemotaxis protein [Thiohalomonadaceae bacterium]
MKLNLPVTQREQTLEPGTLLVSTTDTKGIITEANAAFSRVSGFSHEELLGRNHNLVRHPDMPPAAFEDLWNTLKRGLPWMGIVKNRAKNGDHYWVDAYVAPITENGKVTGYQSVRIPADRVRIRRAENLYRRLLEGKVPLLLRWMPDYALQLFGAFGGVLTAFAGLLLASGALEFSAALAACFTAALVLAAGAARFMSGPVQREARLARAVVDNPVMPLVYTGRRDEIGQIAAAVHMLQARLRTLTARVGEVGGQLTATAEQMADTAGATEKGMARQAGDVDAMATAVHEMATTINDVARNAAQAAEASREADREAKQGARVASEALGGIDVLMRNLNAAAGVVTAVGTRSESITGVLETIRAIAEQTNLLALNAAIEAARAGAQGRGFAVVADEVRSLANRSQQATGEIRATIEELQAGARDAVRAMEAARVQAQEGSDHVKRAADSLAAIAGAVSQITDMNLQIAAAVEQQSQVAEEVNRGIVRIRDEAETAAEAARHAAHTSSKVTAIVGELESVLRQSGG